MASGFGQKISSNYYAVTSYTAAKLSGYVSQSIDRTNRTVTITVSVRPSLYRISTRWDLNAGDFVLSSDSISNYIHAKIGDAASTSGNGLVYITAAKTFSAYGGNDYTAYDGYINVSGAVSFQSVSKTYSYNDNGDAITVGYEMRGRIGGVDFNLDGSVTTDAISPAYVAPTTPTLSVSNIDPFSNRVSFGTTSFGYPSSGTVRLYRGTSPNPTTELTGARKSTTGTSNYTDTGLQPNTTYYYRARAYNGNQWSSYSNNVSIKTKAAALVPYPNSPSQSNTAKYAKKIEAPLNGLAKNVKKLYRSNGGVAQRIY